MQVADNVISIQKQIHEYEERYHRPKGSVTLLGASKGQSITKMREAVASGVRIFGENYLQEALEKMQALDSRFRGNDVIEWHFIGNIQTNKIKKIAEHFDWVQSVSDERIAQKFSQHRSSDLLPLNICLEININSEPTKNGENAGQILKLAEMVSDLPNLKLRGLMAIPNKETTFEAQRRNFRKLTEIFEQLNQNGFQLDTLSMGMSDDMEAAIAEGTTMVRIGTALFGPRQSPQ